MFSAGGVTTVVVTVVLAVIIVALVRRSWRRQKALKWARSSKHQPAMELVCQITALEQQRRSWKTELQICVPSEQGHLEQMMEEASQQIDNLYARLVDMREREEK